uniref:Uncharacterized protein n=1 Tax=Phlebia radiata TaxID=5308 RepID=L8B9H1_PHLRA|nr:hypothetical protein Pra_mt0321 [Phlebia radiata]CCF07389.1 hypothetical protein Pra_mt0321 [Phlebia radiata]
MGNWSYNFNSNDGHRFPGLCSSYGTNVFMGCNRYYEFIISCSSIWTRFSWANLGWLQRK